MNLKKEKEISDIIQHFNRQLSKIFKLIDSIDAIQNNPDLDWVQRVVTIIKNVNPAHIIDRSIDRLWESREFIINRDEKFITENHVDKYIEDDCRKEWMEGLFRYLRSKYTTLKREEITYLWDCINNMLEAVIKYRIIKQDFAI